MIWQVGIRCIQALGVLLAVSLGTFALIHVAPGDPARIVLGPHVTNAALKSERHLLGLDRSLPAQYWSFITGLVQGHFGTSFTTSQPVSALVWPAAATSLLLLSYGIVLSLVVSVPLAIIAAANRGRTIDSGVRLLTMTAFAAPPFVVGVMLILGLSVKLRLFPSAGYGHGFLGHLESLTLPAITLAVFMMPIVVRSLRASLLATLDSDFIEAARARGFSEARILRHHALRNSLLPTITLLGTSVGFLLSQAVVVENVFSIPGLGSLLVSSATGRDFPTIEALTVIFAVLVVAANLIADLAYRIADPRVRL